MAANIEEDAIMPGAMNLIYGTPFICRTKAPSPNPMAVRYRMGSMKLRAMLDLYSFV